MNIFTNISNYFSLDAKESPATEEEIIKLVKFSSIEIPSDYLELVLQATEVEFKVNNETYIRIWGPKDCIEMNEMYYIQKYIPNSLAIGDDEGGSALIYLNGRNGFGLYLCRFTDLDIEEAIKVAPSLTDLLVNNIGINVLY